MAEVQAPDKTDIRDMTDRELLEAFLARTQIAPSGPDERTWPVFEDSEEFMVVLMAKSGNVNGFKGFYGTFEFDETGKFCSLGLWE